MKSVTGQKLGPRIQALKGGSRVRHPACPYNSPRHALQKLRDDRGCLGHGQRDFDDWNPTAGYCLGGEESILCRVHANRGNDTDFLDPASHLEFIHLIVSFSREEKRHSIYASQTDYADSGDIMEGSWCLRPRSVV